MPKGYNFIVKSEEHLKREWRWLRIEAQYACREEALHYLISPHAPVKEVRIILDRQFGVPKGFAFAQFHSVADAAKVLHALQVPLPCI